MRRVLLVVLSCLIPAASLAAAETQVTMKVTLAASPPLWPRFGSPITLTATASKPVVSIIPDPRERVRYTFTAQRTWPCPETVTIASNVLTSIVTWNPQKAGMYDISVRAASERERLTPPSATASLPNYEIFPQSGFSERVVTGLLPLSVSSINQFVPKMAQPTPPVQLTMSVSVNNPPAGRWYRYRYSCLRGTIYESIQDLGCQPASGTKDNQPASTSFQMTLPNAGQYIWSIVVDKVRQSDCTWEQRVVTRAPPDPDPGYTVRAP
jgi:hypothetical protein